MAALVSSMEQVQQNWAAEEQSDDDLPKNKGADASSESDSNDEDDGDQSLLNVPKVAPVKKVSAPVNKNLSKKEREALKKKELEEIDEIFNELGITIEKSPENNANPTEIETNSTAENNSSTKDKDKKKKKKPQNKAKDVEAPAPAEEIALTKEQIKAKLLAKQAALGVKKPVLPESVKEAMKEKKEKKKVYGSFDL